MHPEDVIVLLKIAAIGSCDWTPFQLSLELGHSLGEVEASLDRLYKSGLLRSTSLPDPDALRKFLLIELPDRFPATPGKVTRGMLTGARPSHYFALEMPFTSIWVWSKENGPDWGLEIPPLSPHCCFAAMNDRRLRKLLSITETVRVGGPEARAWAEISFRQCGLF